MQIGISTASFYPLEIEHGIELAAKLGYRHVELFINSESEYCLPFRRELKKRLDALGLHVVSLHPYTSSIEGHLLFSDYPRRTRDALDQHERYFEAAAFLGASYFTFHGELLRARGLPASKSEQNRYQTYRALCERAARQGITFTQENVSWCKSSSIDFLCDLRKNVPELHYTLDIKQARRVGLDWRDYMQAVGDRVVNVHISDYSSQNDCQLPGEGEVDFSALFAKLRSFGCCKQAMVEVYSSDYTMPEQLEQSRLYLEKVNATASHLPQNQKGENCCEMPVLQVYREQGY